MTRITPDDCRRITPELSDMSDEKLEEAIKTLYGLGELALESYFDKEKAKKLD